MAIKKKISVSPKKPATTRTQALIKARGSLASFATLMYTRFEVAAHHRKIIDALEKVERGEIDRLIITLPPRHGKSLLASVMFPSWFLGRNPDKHIIASSYGAALAMTFGRQVRNYTVDRLHRAIFPACVPADDASAVNRFALVQGGSYNAVGSGGSITGRGADLLLIDDPIKDAESARSDSFRAGLKEWYQAVAYPRLQPGGAVVLIQTRWHQDDLAGWLLVENASEGWTVLNLPAVCEKDEAGTDGRKEGDALWPSQYSIAMLDRIKEAVGGATWAALYQGRPAAAEGAMFKRDWWRIAQQAPDKFERVVLSLDTAFKTGKTNDYSVGLTLGVSQSSYFVLDVWREKVEFPELQRKINILCERYRPHEVLVEDQASGQSLIQALQRDTRLPVKPIKVSSDKISRASAILPLIEAGRVVLPAGAEWVAQLVDECATFPNAAHDDVVDALSQALNHVAEIGARGFSALAKFEGARTAVQTGVPIEEAAKQAGVAPSRLEGWLDRQATAPARVVQTAQRIAPEQIEAYEYCRKLAANGVALEAALAETLKVHHVEIPMAAMLAFIRRVDTPLGPSRPMFAPQGAVNPFV